MVGLARRGALLGVAASLVNATCALAYPYRGELGPAQERVYTAHRIDGTGYPVTIAYVQFAPHTGWIRYIHANFPTPRCSDGIALPTDQYGLLDWGTRAVHVALGSTGRFSYKARDTLREDGMPVGHADTLVRGRLARNGVDGALAIRARFSFRHGASCGIAEHAFALHALGRDPDIQASRTLETQAAQVINADRSYHGRRELGAAGSQTAQRSQLGLLRAFAERHARALIQAGTSPYHNEPLLHNMRAFGLRVCAAGENLGFNLLIPTLSWDPAHEENQLDPEFNAVGLGVVGDQGALLVEDLARLC
jgi:hypothetical protein